MRTWVAGLAVLSALWAQPALADRDVKFGPAASWVKPLTIPAATPGVGGAYEILLLDHQVSLSAGGEEAYDESAFKVLNARGLESLGSVAMIWDPLTEVVRFHKVEIIRDGQVIDLLKDGEPFNVIQRETSLDNAVLDGRLTAMKEIHGLRVGDIVHVARSRLRNSTIPGDQPEDWSALGYPGTALHVRHRAVWPKGLNVRWRASDGFGDVRVREADGQMELISDRTGWKTPEPPEGAPERYENMGELELSAFRDWQELSGVFSPLYAQASALQPNSPLKAEAARIMRENPTTEARVAAAVRLVEQEVRYLALAAGDAGLIPAAADVTWQRRFGDCKGKTVLLIALLAELGVKAEPALASSHAGDGVMDRLPRVGAFDHVIVRAVVNGKVYWFDATRDGDRRLESMPEPLLGWVLPLRTGGAALERIEVKPAVRPSNETIIVLDASGGLDAEGPARVELIMRGYEGMSAEHKLSSMSRKEAEDGFRDNWADSAWFKLDKVTYGYDEALDAQHVIMEGRGKFKFLAYNGFREENLESSYKAPFEARPAGPHQDAPFTLNMTAYDVTTYRVKLPQKGQGFDLVGSDMERTVGGVWMKRTAKITNGEAVVVTEARVLQAEIPYREALASVTTLKSLPIGTDVVLRAPRGMGAGPTPMFGLGGGRGSADLKSEEDYLSRVRQQYQMKNYRAALTTLKQAEKAGVRSETLSTILYLTLLHLERVDEAMKEAQSAAALYPDSPGVQYRVGLTLLAQNRPDDALGHYETQLRKRPDDDDLNAGKASALITLGRFADLARFEDGLLERYGAKASARLQLDDVVDDLNDLPDRQLTLAATAFEPMTASPIAHFLRARLTDTRKDSIEQLDAALRLKPDFVEALRIRGNLHQASGDTNKALADFDRVLRFSPDDARGYLGRALAYQRVDRVEEAVLDLDEAIKLDPENAGALNERCWLLGTRKLDLDKALADCDMAINIEPEFARAIDSRAFVNLQMGRFKESLRDYDAAIQLRPDAASSLYGRGIVRRRMGDQSGGDRDIAAATKAKPGITEEFDRYGVKP